MFLQLTEVQAKEGGLAAQIKNIKRKRVQLSSRLQSPAKAQGTMEDLRYIRETFNVKIGKLFSSHCLILTWHWPAEPPCKDAKMTFPAVSLLAVRQKGICRELMTKILWMMVMPSGFR